MRLFSFMLEFDRINIILGDTVSLFLCVSYMKLIWVCFLFFLAPYFDLLLYQKGKRPVYCVFLIYGQSPTFRRLPAHFHLCLRLTLHKRHVWSWYGFFIIIGVAVISHGYRLCCSSSCFWFCSRLRPQCQTTSPYIQVRRDQFQVRYVPLG